MYFLNIIFMLTTSERTIIRLLLEGQKPQEIAKIRSVELSTIKTQITALLKKFGAKRTKDIVFQIRDLQIEQMFSMLPPE